VKLRHLLLVVVLAIAAGGVWYAVTLRNQPPEVVFAHVVREPIASSVPTNGKVEPIEWAEAQAERDGPVTSIMVQRGAQVAAGAALVELDSADARAELVAAQARVSQVKAELDVIARGGRATDLSALAGEMDREKLELAAAQKEYDTLARLQAKQAATAYEVSQAKERVERAQAQIHSLCLLYEHTANTRYLSLAKKIRDEFSATDDASTTGRGFPSASLASFAAFRAASRLFSVSVFRYFST